MYLSSLNTHKVLSFYSKDLKRTATIDEISTHADIATDQAINVVTQLLEAHVLIQVEDRYRLDLDRYHSLLLNEIANYEQIIERYQLIQDRIHQIALTHHRNEKGYLLDQPILLIECISDDKKFIHKTFSDIENLEIRIYTTAQLMELISEKDPTWKIITSAIVLH